MQLKSRLNPLLRNLTCHVAALLLAIIVLVSPYIRIKGASTTMGHHFVFQVPYLQEVGGFAVVSIVTSWNKPFLVKMTIPHVKGIMPREFMLYRLEPVSVELRNMFKLDCHRKRQYVQHVTIRSDPYNMFAVFVSVMDSFLSIETFPAVPVASFTDNYYIVTFDINPVLVVSHYPFEDNHLVTQRLEYESQYKGCTVSTLFVLLELFTLHGDSGIFESCNRTTYSAGQRGEPYLSKQCDLVVSKIPNQSYTGIRASTWKSNFGVIAGNSRTSISKKLCRNKVPNDDSMAAAYEPVLPMEWYGKEYVLPEMSFDSGQRVIRVMGLKYDDQVWYFVDVNITTGTATKVFQIEAFLENLVTDLPKGHHFLKASRQVQVHYVVQHSCERPGSLAYSLLVPMDKGYYHYVWTSPDNQDFHTKNSILIIVRLNDTSSLLLDDVSLPQKTLYKINGRPEMCVVELSVAPGVHDLYSSTQASYLCYLYGNEGQKLYMHPAGYTIEVKSDRCVPETNRQGLLELVDDDCDGRLDEEIADGIDNDMDGLIDEDLNRIVRVNGGWAPWTEWACPAFCEGTMIATIQRIRLCINPKPTQDAQYCIGDDKEMKTDLCNVTEDCSLKDIATLPIPGQWGEWSSWSYPDYCGRVPSPRYEEGSRTCLLKETSNNSCHGFSHRNRPTKMGDHLITCPIDCPEKTFGYDCNKTCYNCMEDCDRLTGYCRLCGAGFTNRSNACNTGCPPFTWGHLCLENCAVKCQTDCIDRVTGECPPPPTDYTILFVLFTWPLTIIPVTCISYLIVRFHRSLVVELEEDYDEILLQ